MKSFNLRPLVWGSVCLAGFALTPAQALNFSPVAGGPNSASVARIDADTNGTLYTASGSQVFSSSDNGATWAAASPAFITGLRQAVADGGNLFVSSSQGVMKSTDGGATYTNFNGAGGQAHYRTLNVLAARRSRWPAVLFTPPRRTRSRVFRPLCIAARWPARIGST